MVQRGKQCELEIADHQTQRQDLAAKHCGGRGRNQRNIVIKGNVSAKHRKRKRNQMKTKPAFDLKYQFEPRGAKREPRGAKPEHTSCPDQAAPGCPDHEGTPGCPNQLGCVHGGVGLEMGVSCTICITGCRDRLGYTWLPRPEGAFMGGWVRRG